MIVRGVHHVISVRVYKGYQTTSTNHARWSTQKLIHHAHNTYHARTRSHTSANCTLFECEWVSALFAAAVVFHASVSAPPALVDGAGISHSHCGCEYDGSGQRVVLWPLQLCTAFPLTLKVKEEVWSNPVAVTVYACEAEHHIHILLNTRTSTH